jgi:hypothetical protein
VSPLQVIRTTPTDPDASSAATPLPPSLIPQTDSAKLDATEYALRQSVAELLKGVRASPLCALKVKYDGNLVNRSIFDQPCVQPDIKSDVISLARAAVSAGHVSLLRAIGCMVGMAIADSIGHNFEFLPVQDAPSADGPFFEYPAPDGPPRGRVHGAMNRFRLQPGQWTDDASMGLCLADCLLARGGAGDAGLNCSALRVWFWNWWHNGLNNAFRLDPHRMSAPAPTLLPQHPHPPASPSCHPPPWPRSITTAAAAAAAAASCVAGRGGRWGWGATSRRRSTT